MRTCYLIILLLISGTISRAQNLVPNPGFEDYDNCPYNIGEVKSAFYPNVTVKHWVNPAMSTTDYFNACSNGYAGVPVNFWGKHPAYNGNAYMGIYAITSARISSNPDTCFHEYIQTPLSTPLAAGKAYEISCFVKMNVVRYKINGDPNTSNRFYALDKIDATFSQAKISAIKQPINVTSFTGMYNRDSTYITDSLNWVKISGIHYAAGGEEWLTIGVFNTNTPPKLLVYPAVEDLNMNPASYYFIDDVSVHEYITCDSIFNSSDTLVCDLNPDLTVYTTAPSESYMHLWNTGSQSLSLNITKPGVYWCTGTSGCNIITDTFHVKMFTDTTITPTTTLPCTTTKLTSSFDADKYRWSSGETTRSISPGKEGKFWCTVVKDCRLMVDTFVVEKPDTLRPERHFVNVCGGDTYTLSTATKGKSYKWDSGETTKDISVIADHHVYTCIITVDECLAAVETFITTPVTPPAYYAQRKNDTAICNTFELAYQYDHRPKYKWNTGDSVCCINVPATGTYTVTLTADGCPPWIDTVAVTITDCENCMFIPSAFTPGNDGLNDVFRAIPSCPVNTFTFRIFNRWGQEVFYTTDPRKGWNGMHGAHLADVGIYFYAVEYTSVAAGKKELLKGDVLLLR